jgi:hypothetical protein
MIASESDLLLELELASPPGGPKSHWTIVSFQIVIVMKYVAEIQGQ